MMQDRVLRKTSAIHRKCGSRQIADHLIEVTMLTGAEKLMVALQSGVGYNRSDDFHNEIAQRTFGLDFSAHVYYVVATLSAPETIEIGTPPAIQMMQAEPA